MEICFNAVHTLYIQMSICCYIINIKFYVEWYPFSWYLIYPECVNCKYDHKISFKSLHAMIHIMVIKIQWHYDNIHMITIYFSEIILERKH